MGVIENRIDITELERSGGGGGGGTAADVSYDNTSSGLSATTVQGAIDELEGEIATPAADDVTYDNTTSGLSATDVQGAVDQLASGLSNANSLISGIDNKANSIANQLSDDGTDSGAKFYFDEQSGVYGFNTSAARGADTFHPFNAGGGELTLAFSDSTAAQVSHSITNCKEGDYIVFYLAARSGNAEITNAVNATLVNSITASSDNVRFLYKVDANGTVTFNYANSSDGTFFRLTET